MAAQTFIDPALKQVAIASAGAIVAEILHWHRLAKSGRFPKYARSPLYWCLTAILIGAAGYLAAAISPPGTSTPQLLLLGMAGPQLFSSLARSQSSIAQKRDLRLGDETRSAIEFFGT